MPWMNTILPGPCGSPRITNVAGPAPSTNGSIRIEGGAGCGASARSGARAPPRSAEEPGPSQRGSSQWDGNAASASAARTGRLALTTIVPQRSRHHASRTHLPRPKRHIEPRRSSAAAPRHSACSIRSRRSHQMANPIEQMAAKAAGTMKAVTAGFKGLRGVFLHLAEEHGEVGALMKRVSKTTDPQVRREHFPHIRAELLSHEKAELVEVYGVLANYEQLRSVVLQHNSEAHTLEKAIADVDVLDFASEEWGTSFGRLMKLVQAHVEHEENDFFPKAQELIDEEE